MELFGHLVALPSLWKINLFNQIDGDFTWWPNSSQKIGLGGNLEMLIGIKNMLGKCRDYLKNLLHVQVKIVVKIL